MEESKVIEVTRLIEEQRKNAVLIKYKKAFFGLLILNIIILMFGAA
jgi:hypothetical protein